MSEVLRQRVERFAADSDAKIARPRAHEMVIELDQNNVRNFISHLVEDLSVRHLSTITGLDLGEGIGIIYHFTHGRDTIHVKTMVPKSQLNTSSIVDIVPGAILYEMEIHDLLGVNFAGNPWMDRKLLLPDTWPDDLAPPLWKTSNPAEIRKRLQLEVEKAEQ